MNFGEIIVSRDIATEYASGQPERKCAKRHPPARRGPLPGPRGATYHRTRDSGGTCPESNSSGAAENSGSGWADLSGVLRDAARGKGNFGIGSATQEEAVAAGRARVGDDATLASDGKTLVSQNGLRQFRPPSYKPFLDKWQANFEWRVAPRGRWLGNGHLDITDAP
jgi:hypothetical protein